jgi:hypothetical protein
VQVWRSAGYWQENWRIAATNDKGQIVVLHNGEQKDYESRELLEANPQLLAPRTALMVRRSNGQVEHDWEVSGWDEAHKAYVMARGGLTRRTSLDELLRENPSLLPPPEPQPREDVAFTALRRVDDLIGGWAQGKEGNCASVAVIKAAMKTYGSDIFTEVRKYPSGHYQVRMRDGVQVDVTKQEIERMSHEANFRGQFRGYPLLCFSVIAKRKAMEHDEGARDFNAAISLLNNGQNPINAARLLGLKNQVQMIPLSEIPNFRSAVVYSHRHGVYAERNSNGAFYDAWGKQRPQRLTVVGEPAIEAFIFKPDR